VCCSSGRQETGHDERDDEEQAAPDAARNWLEMDELGGGEYAASSSSSSSQSCRLSSAQRCVSDVLHLIYSHLSLPDQLHAALTCKHWLAAARRDRVSQSSLSLQHNHECRHVTDRDARLISLSLARSSLRHWVTSLQLPHSPRASLHHLACALELPRLRSLTYCLNPAAIRPRLNEADRSGRPIVLQLPRTLTSLDLTINYHPHTEIQRRCHFLAMQALTRLPSLQRLYIRVDHGGTGRPIDEDWSMLPSLRNSLRHLHITSIFSSHDILDYVKQLRLHSLYLGASTRRQHSWSVLELRKLCDKPSELNRLQSLGPLIDSTLTGKHMKELINLPNLTTLTPRSFTIDALSFLPHFLHLTELSVHVPLLALSSIPRELARDEWDDEYSARWMDAAAPHLAACPALISIKLKLDVGFNDHRLDTFFRYLSHLRRLSIHCCQLDMDAHHPGQTLHVLTHVAWTVEELHLESGVWNKPVPLLPSQGLPRLHLLTLSERDVITEKSWDWNGNVRQDENGNDIMALMEQMGTTIQRTPNLTTIKIGKATYDVTTKLAEVGKKKKNEICIMDVQWVGASSSSHPHR